MRGAHALFECGAGGGRVHVRKCELTGLNGQQCNALNQVFRLVAGSHADDRGAANAGRLEVQHAAVDRGHQLDKTHSRAWVSNGVSVWSLGREAFEAIEHRVVRCNARRTSIHELSHMAPGRRVARGLQRTTKPLGFFGNRFGAFNGDTHDTGRNE